VLQNLTKTVWCIRSVDLVECNCSCYRGKFVEETQKLADDVLDRNIELREEWCHMSNNNVTPLPCSPLDVLPKITPSCVTSWYVCYHRRYWTDIVSPSEYTLGGV
jgi:hypothetical protein